MFDHYGEAVKALKEGTDQVAALYIQKAIRGIDGTAFDREMADIGLTFQYAQIHATLAVATRM